MRKILVLLIFVCSAIGACNAQNGSGAFLEAGLGFTHSEYKYRQRTGGTVIVDLRAGYSINSMFTLGAMMKSENYSDDWHFKCWGGFAEYRFFKASRIPLYLFVDLHGYHAKGHTVRVIMYGAVSKDALYGTEFLKNFTEIGFTPGIGFTIPRTPLSIRLRYLFIGFNDANSHGIPGTYYKDYRGCLGGGNWIVDAGLRRLEISVSATLNFWNR